MTTAAQAFVAVKARLTGAGSGISIPLRWQGEDQPPLPDKPAAFAYVVFNVFGSGRGPEGIGGGRGNNLYRNQAVVEAFVFTPMGLGLEQALVVAETVAARLRSFRDADISCFSADVIPVGEGSSITPPGLSSEVNNYQCAVAEIGLHFDQIG